MNQKITASPLPKIRFYLDNGSANPLIDVGPLQGSVHEMFVHWVKSHYRERDFLAAMEHVAGGLYAHYAIEGSPDLTQSKSELPELVALTSVPTPTEDELKLPTHLFFDEEGNLSHAIDTDDYRKVLVPHFCRWLVANYHPRDFVQAVKDAASTVYYDYVTHRALGGLGGGKDREAFLNTPFRK